MYNDSYTPELIKKLSNLQSKDKKQYTLVRKKMEWILSNPEHRFKDLHFSMKFFKRIHIGHVVLIFRVDRKKQIVIFEDYDHHDKIYRK